MSKGAQQKEKVRGVTVLVPAPGQKYYHFVMAALVSAIYVLFFRGRGKRRRRQCQR